MKIYKSKRYDHWISPYTLAEKICFWREIDYDEPWVQRFNRVMEPVMQIWQTVLNVVDIRQVDYVKIDAWDTWSMDTTLADIVLPMLRQLKDTKHGAPHVDYDDVPARLRPTSKQQARFRLTGETDPKFFERWEWVLDEMIWAFEQIADPDSDSKFFSGNWSMLERIVETDADGKPLLRAWEPGPDHTYKLDKQAWNKHQKRIDNGTRLFGKYYRSLWD